VLLVSGDAFPAVSHTIARKAMFAPVTIDTLVGFKVEMVTLEAVVVQFSRLTPSFTYLISLKSNTALDSEILALKVVVKDVLAVTVVSYPAPILDKRNPNSLWGLHGKGHRSRGLWSGLHKPPLI